MTKKILTFAVLLSVAAGCTTQVRVITADSWVSDQHYLLTYWEGKCKKGGMGSCDKGTSEVQVCKVKADNGLDCKSADKAKDILNPHKR